ncbi:MAG: triose-phosphate isomerase [Gammaproteobacteria bacterium]
MYVANWKMNNPSSSAAEWIDIVSSSKRIENCILCPPSTLLEQIKQIISKQNLPLTLGAQDVDPNTETSLTGGISAKMLKEFGCEYVIVGHSERRDFYKEGSDLLFKKVSSTLLEGLKVIFCIGESKEERDSGLKNNILSEQLKAISKILTKDVIIAYEPVWAIGSGETPSFEEINQTNNFLIKKLISFGLKQDDIKILYGGSVNSSNSEDILHLENVSGLLIGGASLDGAEFLKIIG